MIKLKYLPVFFLMALLFSCKSIPDDFIMFNDLNKGKSLNGTVINPANEKTVILPGNVLQIIVSSENLMDTKILEQFNLLPLTSIDPTLTRVGSDMAFQTYTVNEIGEIEFPKAGKIKVQGLTHFELEAFLQGNLKQYISNPVVRVNIRQNWIRVFGEVNIPGLYSIQNRFRYSILDALAEAGGITTAGDKKRVKLIREEDGKLESVVLDLTTSNVFTSPYYYMKPNDVIIVDPNSTRRKDAQYGSADNYRLSVISTILGSVSVLVSMVLLVINNAK